MPKLFTDNGHVIRTLSQATYTPPSFTSLISSLSPENHNVRWFFDTFDTKKINIFDFFKNGSFYDSPDDPMSKIVFKNLPGPIELPEIQEPFVWIERLMDTHTPYGKIDHGNAILYDVTNDRTKMGEDFLKKSKKRDSIKKDYMMGVKKLENHLIRHLIELKRRGIFNKTLLVITSDHGELLGERIYFRKRYSHSWPICRQLVEVPTIFINYPIESKFMRQLDILPTCLDILKKPYDRNFDGKSIVKSAGIENMFGKVIGRIHRSKKYHITNWKYNVNSNNFEKYKSEKIYDFVINMKENILLGVNKLKKEKGDNKIKSN